MNIAINPELPVQRISIWQSLFLDAGGFSCVIHDVDSGELLGGGETHAYTVLKLAALDNPRSQSPVYLPFIGLEEGTVVA